MLIIQRFCVLLLCIAGAQISIAEGRTLHADDFMHGVFRGFTLDRASQKSAADFQDMARMGVDLVRVGITLERCEGCREYTLPPSELATVDRVLAQARVHRMNVILVLEPERSNEQSYWGRADLRGSIERVWGELARRYKGEPAMAGFDLINEPNPPGSAREASLAFRLFAARLIETIRGVDPERMVVFEPAPRGNAYHGFKEMKEPLPYGNVLYSPHFYYPVEFTHQGLGGFPAGVTYPTTKIGRNELMAYLEPVRVFARRFNVPIYVGEFSAVRFAPGRSAHAWLEDAITLFEAEGWSWTYHAFRGYHGWDAELPAGVQSGAEGRPARRVRNADTEVMQLLRRHLNPDLAGGR